MEALRDINLNDTLLGTLRTIQAISSTYRLIRLYNLQFQNNYSAPEIAALQLGGHGVFEAQHQVLCSHGGSLLPMDYKKAVQDESQMAAVSVKFHTSD